MLQDLLDLHYSQEEASSFMQQPCFLAPSPLHSACHPEENETEPWLQELVVPGFPVPSLNLAQDLHKIVAARKSQKGEVYSFLSALHGGHFKRFALEFGRGLAAQKLKKKKGISKVRRGK